MLPVCVQHLQNFVLGAHHNQAPTNAGWQQVALETPEALPAKADEPALQPYLRNVHGTGTSYVV
jgi:hypothetical protein